MSAIDFHTPLTEQRRYEIVDAVARKIVSRRLETAAVLFLEMHKPLSFIASQGVVFALPFLAPVLGPQRMADLSKLLRDRGNVELLISRIEEMSDENHRQNRAKCEQQG